MNPLETVVCLIVFLIIVTFFLVLVAKKIFESYSVKSSSIEEKQHLPKTPTYPNNRRYPFDNFGCENTPHIERSKDNVCNISGNHKSSYPSRDSGSNDSFDGGCE